MEDSEEEDDAEVDDSDSGIVFVVAMMVKSLRGEERAEAGGSPTLFDKHGAGAVR